ncbi:MAG: hypothetical protein H0X72_10510 [Acidobacteria bacterium]|nr:hypothetical protein [Acidobacteriota bacterium]
MIGTQNSSARFVEVTLNPHARILSKSDVVAAKNSLYNKSHEFCFIAGFVTFRFMPKRQFQLSNSLLLPMKK